MEKEDKKTLPSVNWISIGSLTTTNAGPPRTECVSGGQFPCGPVPQSRLLTPLRCPLSGQEARQTAHQASIGSQPASVCTVLADIHNSAKLTYPQTSATNKQNHHNKKKQTNNDNYNKKTRQQNATLVTELFYQGTVFLIHQP